MICSLGNKTTMVTKTHEHPIEARLLRSDDDYMSSAPMVFSTVSKRTNSVSTMS